MCVPRNVIRILKKFMFLFGCMSVYGCRCFDFTMYDYSNVWRANDERLDENDCKPRTAISNYYTFSCSENLFRNENVCFLELCCFVSETLNENEHKICYTENRIFFSFFLNWLLSCFVHHFMEGNKFSSYA